MRRSLLILALVLIAGNALTQDNAGPGLVIEGRVFLKTTSAAVPNVLVMLSPASESEDLSMNFPPGGSANLPAQITALRGRLQTPTPPGIVQLSVDSVLRAAGATARPSTYMFTDSAGGFSFRNLAPGRYAVRAMSEGYFGPKLRGSYPGGFAKIVEMRPDKPLVALDVPLTKGSVIRGYVLVPPAIRTISGIPIDAYRLIYTNGREKWEWLQRTGTDITAKFALENLPPGPTYVRLTLPGRADPIFFDNVTDIDRATKITLKEDDRVYVEFRSQPSNHQTFSISGVAINPYNPTGAVNQSVSTFVLARQEATPLDPPYTIVQNRLTTSGRYLNGDFEIAGVEAGSYDLISYTTDAATRRTLTGRSIVQVRGGNVSGVSVPIQPGFTLSGGFVFTGSNSDSLKAQSLYVELESLGSMPGAFVTNPNPITIDASAEGRFGAFNVPQERYRFVVKNLPAKAYLADIKQYGQSVFDRGFELTDRNDPVQIVISTQGQTVGGVVRTADGRNVESATVVLIPTEEQRQNPMRYRVGDTDAEGLFQWNDVPPGQYTIFAWESILPTAWMNSKVLEKYKDRGRLVNITAGISTELQLAAISDTS
jgi:hypothetical protein